MGTKLDIEALDPERIAGVVDEVEAQTGYTFHPCELQETIQYTARKCELTGKDEEYFYLLLRDELMDYLFRAYINAVGEINRRRRQQCVPSAT